MKYDYSDRIVNINFLHDYNYEFFWGMCHGAKINPTDIQIASGNLFSKYMSEREHDYSGEEQIFKYRNQHFRISWQSKPRSKFINIFNLNYWYFLNKNGGSEEAVVPVGNFYDEITNDIIPNLNDLIKETKEHEPYTICWMFNKWEPQTGFTLEDGPYLRGLHENIPIFTDNLKSNDEVLAEDGIDRKNRFKSYTQFVNSLFWPSTLYFREFYHHYEIFKNQSRNTKWKFHYMTRRWYPDKMEVAHSLIKLNKPDSIGITTSSSFNEIEEISLADSTLNTTVGDQKDEWKAVRTYFDKNPSELNYHKRGYNLDDFGNEGICDNSRELLHRIYPLSNITILHEHEHHTSEKIIAHIILGKPFLPVYYKTLDNIQQMFDNDSDLKIPPPPFERYETIHDILDKIENWSNGKNWETFRDDMYEWVYEFRKVLLEYMNNHNSLFNAIIDNHQHFKNK